MATKNTVHLPKELFNRFHFPMWQCEKCKAYFDPPHEQCPVCGGKRSPPNRSKYVHEVLMPQVSEEDRDYLAQYFTVLFQNGFEDDFESWTSTSGTPTIVTSPTHHGGKSCQINADEYARKTLASAYATVYARLYIQFAALPWAEAYYSPFLLLGASANWAYATEIQAYNYDGTNCRFMITDGASGSQQGTTVIALDNWYCVELKRVTGSGSSTMSINGVQEASVAYGYYDANQLQVGGAFSLDSVGYIDCVRVDDTGPIGLEGISVTVTSFPSAIEYTWNGNPFNTPYTHEELEESSEHTAVMPESAQTDYYFTCWEDNTTNRTRTVIADQTKTIKAYYQLLNYIQQGSDGSGKKQRHRIRTFGSQTVYEQHLRYSQKNTYFVVNTAAQTNAANLHFISLFNAANSGRIIIVKDILWRNGKLSAISNPTAIEVDLMQTTAQGSNGTTLTPRKFDSTNLDIPAQITALQAPSGAPTTNSVILPMFLNQEEIQVASEWAHSSVPIFGRGELFGARGKRQCQQITLREGQGITIKQISAAGTPAGSFAFQIVFILE